MLEKVCVQVRFNILFGIRFNSFSVFSVKNTSSIFQNVYVKKYQL